MIILGLIILGVSLVGLGIWMLTQDDTDMFGALPLALGIMASLIGSIWIITSYVDNLKRLAEMEAFYSSNIRAYESTYEKTLILISADEITQSSSLIPIEGSIEKIKIGELTADKLTEYRDEIVRYNNDLAKFRKLDHNWAIGIIYPTPSPELQFFTMR